MMTEDYVRRAFEKLLDLAANAWDEESARRFYAMIRGRLSETDWRRLADVIGVERAAQLFYCVRCEGNLYPMGSEIARVRGILALLGKGVPASVILEAAEAGSETLTWLLYGEASADLAEALRELAGRVLNAAKALMEMAEGAEKVEPRPFREPFPHPPRSAVARGLSPVQCRYWVNYRARDKLPCKARKSPANRTGGQGHAENQKAGISGSRRRH